MAYKRISPTPIVEGGTNATSFGTTDGALYFDGTRLVTTATGSLGQLLTSNGVGFAPTFQSTAINKFPITPYVVGPVGIGGYQTIQSALDAAYLAGGGAVWVTPGTYTENLTLYSTTQLVGAVGNSDASGTGSDVTIIGTHTPASTGFLGISNINFISTGDILASTAAGSSIIILQNCLFNSTLGWTFNVPNWTGSLAIFNCQDSSTVNGIVNNTGGALCFFQNSNMGVQTSLTVNNMITSGVTVLKYIDIACPWTSQGGVFQADGCVFEQTVLVSSTASGEFSTCRFTTGTTQALTQSSTGTIALVSCVIDSTNAAVIGGSGAGTITMGGITFLEGTTIAGTLTVTGAGGFLPADFGTSTYVFTSNGPGVIPTFQAAPSGGISTIDGDAGTPITGSIITLTGGTSGAVFIGYSATATMSFNLINLPDTSNPNLGVYEIKGDAFLHAYPGVNNANIWLGILAGNFSFTPTYVYDCIGIGAEALRSITYGGPALAIGGEAGLFALTPSNFIAIGFQASLSNAHPYSIVSIGDASAYTDASGTNYVSIGTNAAYYINGGNNNVFIGANVASAYTTTESSNIIIGDSVPGVIAESNTIRIGTQGTGTSQQSTCYIAGISGATITGAQAVGVTSTGQLAGPTILNNSAQPAFSYYLTSTLSDVTGDGTTYNVAFDTAIFDQDSNVTAGTTFTAPVAGVYLFAVSVLTQSATTANTCVLQLDTTSFLFNSNSYSAMDNGDFPINYTALVKMAMGDTATVNLIVGGGAKIVGIYGASGDPRTTFSGYLVA